MSSRLAVVAGLVTGVLAAGALLLAVLVLGPDGRLAGDPSPSPSSSSEPSRSPVPTASPVASSGPSASAPAPPPSTSPSGSPGQAAFHIGEPAPPLALPAVGGGTIDLAALRGRPVWVNFMATWCPPCIDEFPLMNGFAARHEDDGLVILAVDVEESEATVAAFADRLNATFPIGLDEDGAAQEAWGAALLPVHFWIDAEGIVRDGALGGIGPDVMAAGLESIMPGVEVTP